MNKKLFSILPLFAIFGCGPANVYENAREINIVDGETNKIPPSAETSLFLDDEIDNMFYRWFYPEKINNANQEIAYGAIKETCDGYLIRKYNWDFTYDTHEILGMKDEIGTIWEGSLRKKNIAFGDSQLYIQGSEKVYSLKYDSSEAYEIDIKTDELRLVKIDGIEHVYIEGKIYNSSLSSEFRSPSWSDEYVPQVGYMSEGSQIYQYQVLAGDSDEERVSHVTELSPKDLSVVKEYTIDPRELEVDAIIGGFYSFRFYGETNFEGRKFLPIVMLHEYGPKSMSGNWRTQSIIVEIDENFDVVEVFRTVTSNRYAMTNKGFSYSKGSYFKIPEML